MKITYDKSSDAAYIKFEVSGDSALAQDHVDGEWPVNVDVTKDGKVIGIEIMNASEMMNVQYLEKASQPPKTKVQIYLEQKDNSGPSNL